MKHLLAITALLALPIAAQATSVKLPPEMSQQMVVCDRHLLFGSYGGSSVALGWEKPYEAACSHLTAQALMWAQKHIAAR